MNSSSRSNSKVKMTIDPGSNPASPRSTTSTESPSSKRRSKQWCLCSPTSHPGSFRCRFHRSLSSSALPSPAAASSSSSSSSGGGSASFKWQKPAAAASSSSSSSVSSKS